MQLETIPPIVTEVGAINVAAVIASIPPDVLAAERERYEEAERIEGELAADDAAA